MKSFNPYRVFRFAATVKIVDDYIVDLAFQSLSGFQVRCNVTPFLAPIEIDSLFQSLSGFQVRCNIGPSWEY